MTQPGNDPPANSQPSPEEVEAIAQDSAAPAPDAPGNSPQADEEEATVYTGPKPILSTNEPVLSPALNRYECKACGYIYEPQIGDSRSQIAKDTAFVELPDTWRCPVCGSKKPVFVNIGPGGQPSGFEENLGYGLGVNTLSPAFKNLLIFGSLGAALAVMLSLYGLR